MELKLKRYLRMAFILAVIAFPLCIIGFSYMHEIAMYSWFSGFAVDDDGLLYIGKTGQIDVYSDGKFVKTIYRQNGIVYKFTIKDDKLYVDDSITRDIRDIRDLSGNLISKTDSNGAEMMALRSRQDIFETSNAKYVATNTFGFYKITRYGKDGGSEVVYQMPTRDFLFSLTQPLFVILIIVILVGGFMWLYWHKKSYPNAKYMSSFSIFKSVFKLIFTK